MSRQQLTSDMVPLDSIGKHNLNRLDLALTLAGFGAAARKEILGRVERDLPIVIKNGPQATGKTVLYELLESYVARVYEEDDEGVLYIHVADKYVSVERKDGTLAIGDYRPPVPQDDTASYTPDPMAYLGSKGTEGGDIDSLPVDPVPSFDPSRRAWVAQSSFTLREFIDKNPELLDIDIKTIKIYHSQDPISGTGESRVSSRRGGNGMTLKELLGAMSDTERVLIDLPGRGQPRLDGDYFARRLLPDRIVEAGSLTMREIGPILDRTVRYFGTSQEEGEESFIRIEMKMLEREPIATITVGEGVGAEND